MVSPPLCLQQGTVPLLLSFPHDGTELPGGLRERLTPAASRLPDTDWHVARLYEFAQQLGASLLVARVSRYVVDLNRDPRGAELYPGADNTELCPTTTFEREAIYLPGQEPSGDEIAARVRDYFEPYHRTLGLELERLRARFGAVVLFDAHSIRSRAPRFFDGELPALNLGSAGGKSAHPALTAAVFEALEHNDAGLSAVLDGRFQGGYITRHYGRPDAGQHALQLELAQQTYMREEHPYAFDDARAERLRPVLRAALTACVEFLRTGSSP